MLGTIFKEYDMISAAMELEDLNEYRYIEKLLPKMLGRLGKENLSKGLSTLRKNPHINHIFFYVVKVIE